MTKYPSSVKNSNKNNILIEMHHNFRNKLNIAEIFLKTLGIQYHIKTPKTHNSKLKKSLIRKSLSQVQEELIKL
jgi:hypothetical protein